MQVIRYAESGEAYDIWVGDIYYRSSRELYTLFVP